MSLTEQLEEKYNINIEKLNPLEKETYYQMLDAVQKSQLNPEKLRDYIISMREAVSDALIDEPEFIRIFIFKFINRKQIYLKARLKNYILLESFLLSPKKAEEKVSEMMAGLTSKVN